MRKYLFKSFLFLKIHSISFADCDTSQVELWGECYSLSATNISLPNRSLTGPIPPEIGLFENLIKGHIRFFGATFKAS